MHATARAGGPTPLPIARELLEDVDDDDAPGAAAARLVLRSGGPCTYRRSILAEEATSATAADHSYGWHSTVTPGVAACTDRGRGGVVGRDLGPVRLRRASLGSKWVLNPSVP